MKLYQTHYDDVLLITNHQPVNKEEWTEETFSGKLNELVWWLHCASRQAFNNYKTLDITLEFGNNLYHF